MELFQNTKVWHATVDTSGRVLLPAELRQAMNATPGKELIWTKVDDGVKLQNLDELLGSIQDYFGSLSPASEIWSDELVQERREEASRE